MGLRLMEVVVLAEREADVARLIAERAVVPVSRGPVSEARVAFRLLVPAEATEALSDDLANALAGNDGFRIILTPVEATLPPFEEALSEDARTRQEHEAAKAAARISREELYATVAAQAELSPVYATMIALSSLVAALGLVSGDPGVGSW